MQYLFFDIECANCFNGAGKICSFGYVLTNENLDILEQRDIIINPRQKFHLRSRGSSACDIELAYPLETFRNAPDFPHYYKQIRDMLTAPDRRVFGHSVNNDMRFLMSECVRYKLDFFDFCAYDTQTLHRYFTKAQNDCGLSKICEAFGIDCSQALHRSDYDAYLTMQVFARLCKDAGVQPEGLLELCPNAYYTAEKGKIVNHYATIAYSKRLLEFARHCRPVADMQNDLVKDKYFCFSKAFESEKYKESLYLIKQIRNLGGYYTDKLNTADVYLQWGEPCARTQRLPERRQQDKPICVVDEEQLISMLGVNRQEYDACPLMSFTQLRGKRRRRKPASEQQQSDASPIGE